MRRGVLFGFVAYGIWGLFPLYWPYLRPASATEILAHRVVWSAAVMVVVMTLRRNWSIFRALPRRAWGQLAAAAVLIAINWGVYIAAVNGGRVVDAALGYFVNPLVSVALAVLVLHERLRRLQWLAVGIAVVGVVVLTVQATGFPWIGISLALSFALYSLVKKVIPLGPIASLTGESLLLAPLALGYLVLLAAHGQATFGDHLGHSALLVGAGLITVIPLVAFAVAAQALPLSMLGLMQYLTPTAQFLLGVFWAHEQMPAARWVGFAIIWAALAVFTVDALRQARARPLAGDAASLA